MSPELHQRVRKIFDEAMERPEGERLGYVRAVCARDPEAYEAVVRLIEAQTDSRHFLQEETAPMPRIGRYVITGELGRGAMGVVYEALDPLIGRKVAVKVINLESMAGAREAAFLRDRLFREAHSAGVLSHPGIVIVFDVGQEGDTAFIAMERVDGTSLLQIQDSGRKIARPQALEILRQVASALDYAHRNGVIHRDIKPANIMLDMATNVKVADFGIAKTSSTQQLTQTGMVMGTPSYMSPEQIEALPLDGKSDQFSLAVVAYELLTGSKPFQAESLATLAHMIVYAQRPSARAANPQLSPAVDAVLLRGLSRLPQDRYPTCEAFVGALDEACRSVAAPAPAAIPVPPAAIPAVPPPAPAPTVAEHKKAPVLILVGAILVTAVLGFVLYRQFLQPAVDTASKQPASSTPVTMPAPVINRFSATPQTLQAGESATLLWNVTGANEVSIDQGVGKVATADTLAVKPAASTTYILTAAGPGGKISAQTVVEVKPAEGKPADGKSKAVAEEPAKKAPVDKAARMRQLYDDGVAARHAGQKNKAVSAFRQAADLGEARAMEQLGEINSEGIEDGGGNVQEATSWFRKAAELGSIPAMLNLGAMYYLGNGVLEDYQIAGYWYGKAAAAGDASGMFDLGRMYESGRGFPRDVRKAAELYRRAADLGNAEAKLGLARLSKGGR